MYILKLYNNWEINLQKKVEEEKNKNKYAASDRKALLKNYTNTIKKIKEITKIIVNSKVIEKKKDYTIYELIDNYWLDKTKQQKINFKGE
jgi:hypothetical protein